MNPFKRHTGRVAPLMRADVDTDQIIPKQFLKRIERSGFGEFLFYDWRRQPSGELDDDFVLNRREYAGVSILVAGRNFGCGSSREHAPWALADYGFRAIIAPSFADIFANNCIRTGLLPVALDEPDVALLASHATRLPGYAVSVDLEDQVVHDSSGFVAPFEIGAFDRRCLLEGLDDIGLTLKFETEIAVYETQNRSR